MQLSHNKGVTVEKWSRPADFRKNCDTMQYIIDSKELRSLTLFLPGTSFAPIRKKLVVKEQKPVQHNAALTRLSEKRIIDKTIC